MSFDEQEAAMEDGVIIPEDMEEPVACPVESTTGEPGKENVSPGGRSSKDAATPGQGKGKGKALVSPVGLHLLTRSGQLLRPQRDEPLCAAYELRVSADSQPAWAIEAADPLPRRKLV
jgi:hypothetical protein